MRTLLITHEASIQDVMQRNKGKEKHDQTLLCTTLPKLTELPRSCNILPLWALLSAPLAATTSMCIPEIDPYQTVDTLHTIAAVHLHCVHLPSEPPSLSRHYESYISVHIAIATKLLQPAAQIQWQSTSFPEDRVTLQKDNRQWSRLAFLFRLFPREKSNPKSIDIHN
jgi:hypothetical protein